LSPQQRPQFRERQRLTATDLQAEQNYLLGLAGRHHIGPHSWGIVRGLKVAAKDNRVAITPGLAIDGYGRELALLQPVNLLLPDEQSYIYLYYCERPHNACGAGPHLRWQDSAEVTVSLERWPVPSEHPGIQIGRSAGNVPGLVPWPILLGCIAKKNGSDNDRVDFSGSLFTRLRTATVASPSGQAVMRVGQVALSDQFHVSISGANQEGVLHNRFAFDREGNPIVWGDVAITGATRAIVLQSPIAGQLIKIAAKQPAGTKILWRAIPGTADGVPTLELTVRDKSNPDPVTVERHVFRFNQGLVAAMAAFSQKSKLVTLRVLGKPTRKAARPKGDRPSDTLREDSIDYATFHEGEASVDYEGGVITFSPENNALSHRFDYDGSNQNTTGLPDGLVFQAGRVPPANPSREIYCFRAGASEQQYSDQFRITGGTFKEGDFNRRVTIGHQERPDNMPPAFKPWMTMRGNGTIELIGIGQRNAQNRLYPMIFAHGTVEPPPIRPDPRDPLFNYLTVLAFINGVLALSSSLFDLTLSNVPPQIDPAGTWKYNLTLKNLSSTVPLVPLKNIVTIKGDNKNVRLTELTNLPQQVDPGQAQMIEVEHGAQDIPTGAARITLSVSMAMQAGTFTVARESAPVEISVAPIIG
jgi:hypothetical protein